jgi:voltage-gated potassium channel
MAAIYFLLPVPGRMHPNRWEIFFWCGVALLGSLILLAIRRLFRAGEAARVRGLIMLLCLTVLFFAYADRTLAELPGQFADLQTKTDALYFNVSTVATVGFGDVHATGQLARSAVTIQIVFNLVFLGTAVGMISGMVRARANQRAQTSGTGQAGRPADRG